MTATTNTPTVITSDTVLHLDPRTLLAHPLNPRKKVGKGLKGLAASFKEVGIIRTLSVFQDENGYCLLAGHRQAEAAILAELPTVPCVEVDPGGVPLAKMLAENTGREDLTPGEEADAYLQLRMDYGWSVAQIAQSAGRDQKRVKAGLLLAANDGAKQAADRHSLTFEVAAAIADFGEDDEAVRALTSVATDDPTRFRHALSELRQEREQKEAVATYVRKRLAAGVTAVDGDGWEKGDAEPLRSLVSTRGATIDPVRHERCPGHVEVVRARWDGEPFVVAHCAEPSRYRHLTIAEYRTRERAKEAAQRGEATTDAEVEARVAEARREAQQREQAEASTQATVRTNNKKWRAAEVVRREFVASLFERSSVPKQVLRYCTEYVLGSPGKLSDTDDTLLAGYLGVKPGSLTNGYGEVRSAIGVVRRTADARLPFVLLAEVAASIENRMDVFTWRREYLADEAAWLRFLGTLGYPCSEIEASVVATDDARAERIAQAAAPEVPDSEGDGSDAGAEQADTEAPEETEPEDGEPTEADEGAPEDEPGPSEEEGEPPVDDEPASA